MAYRVGIVGAGENARDHGRACSRLKQTELVAVCDISEAAAQRYAREFGVPRQYTKLEEMLTREGLDIVIVSVWGAYHAEVCTITANSGKVRAILVEKPISLTAAECEQMIAAACANHVLLMEGYKFRHHPQHIRVKEIIDSACIGQVKAVRGTFSSPLVRYADPGNWRYDPRKGGGSVFDTAGYLIHFARYVTEMEPQQVYAVAHWADSKAVELSATILLDFPQGVTAQLLSSYEYGYCQSTEILGTRGWIRVELPFDQRSVREVEFVEKEELPATIHVFHDNLDAEHYQFSPVNEFELQLAHLCDCLETGKPARISPEFSLGNMRAIDAVYQSIKTHGAVQIG